MFQEISIANRGRINPHSTVPTRNYSMALWTVTVPGTLTPQSEIVHVTRALGTVLVLQCAGACGAGSTRFFRSPFEI